MDPILRPIKHIGNKIDFTVYGGLNYIRGNKKPHFSITVAGKDNESWFGGCCHDLILQHYPELTDLVSLHLSDIDGLPIHAVKNGYYWLTAAQNTNKYETGNNKDNIDIFARYVRISRFEVKKLMERIRDKKDFINWIESQKPRYKKEAEETITRHGLIVFGDHWDPTKQE